LKKSLKIFVTGTRGIPDIPGGVEKHCQKIYPLIASMGANVCVSNRRPYVLQTRSKWRHINLIDIYAPKNKSLEAIVHTFLSILTAKRHGADIIHIHAVGPGLMVPLAKLIGLKVVVTNHGPDYNRQKWNTIAKSFLRLGEYLSGKYADAVICISPLIEKTIQQRCRRDTFLIKNGVDIRYPSSHTDFLDKINVEPGAYILAVARFVPEKGLDLLIDAFQKLDPCTKLVIAGDADHETEYSASIKRIIDHNTSIIRTGYITGEPLHQLYSHARLFVLPSYHEGLPIAMLEALSYGIQVLASDIPANCQVNLSSDNFFRCGNITSLYEKMRLLIQTPISEKEKSRYRSLVRKDYNWNDIAAQTLQVYNKITNTMLEDSKRKQNT
jgi:glycosyltransferase involved in cell wall biosynthesis